MRRRRFRPSYDDRYIQRARIDAHPLMSRMHKPDPRLGPDEHDKRSMVAIELADVDAWLIGTEDVARSLVRVPPVEVFDAGPV
jgi:hypothetical protein